MLQGIRNASQHWLGKIVLTVIFTLLIAGVGIFGVEEFFRGGSSNAVATVGKTPITAEQVRQAYQNQVQRYQQQLKRALTPEQARMLGLERQVMSQLVTEAALDQKTRDLGLGVPDASVIRAIHEEKSFQNPQGAFEPALFYQTLQRAGLNEPMFVREQRSVIARLQLAEAVSSDLHVPQAMRDAVHRYTTERRAAAYLVLTPSVAGQIPEPTAEALKAWYEGNKAGFRAPETRSASLLVLEPEAMAKPDAVSAADTQAAYAANIGRYGSPEKRTIQQVVFSDAAGAEAARKQIADGATTFEAVADARGTDAKDLTLGTLTKPELFDRSVADAAFALPEGGVSQPVQGRFGTVLLRVTAIEASSVKPFAEVEPEIRRTLALTRAREGMETARDAIEDQRAGAKSLADVAAERGLPLVAIKSVDAPGRSPDGRRMSDIPDPDTTLPALFRAEVGGDNEPLRTKSGGYVWFDVTGIEPAHDKPLGEVEDAVKAGWTAAEVSKRLQAKGRELVEKLDRGAAIETVAQEVGLNVQEAQDIARNQGKDLLTPDVVNLIFATQVGKAGTAAFLESRAVFRVAGASMPAYAAGSPSDKTIAQSFQAALADDVLAEYISEVQKNAGVSVDQAALRRALGGEF